MWPFKNSKDPEILIRELNDQDPKVRTQAFHQLISQENEKVDRLVLGELKAYRNSSESILLALVEIAGARQIIEVLPIFREMIKDCGPKLKERTLRSLITIPTQESLDILLTCLTDKDPKISTLVREAVISKYGEDSLGALIRAVPEDKTSSMYFEIVSLMEELELFTVIKENFKHPDVKVKEFHFQTLIKFHRPDFIPLFLDYYEVCSLDQQSIVEKTLEEYKITEIIPAFLDKYSKSITEKSYKLAEKLIFPKYIESKEEVLKFAINIPDAKFRVRILSRLIDRLDPFVFEIALKLVYDSVAEIRLRAVTALSNIIKSTYQRLSDKKDQNREVLLKLYESWEKLIVNMLKDSELPSARQKEVRRLFYSLVANKHNLIRPFVGYFMQSHFSETYHYIKEWDFNDQFELFSWLLTNDSSYAAVFLSALQDNPDSNLWRLIFKLIYILDEEDKEPFRKKIVARHGTLSLEMFLKDFDPMIRVTAIEFASELNVNGLHELLKNSMKDPSPKVRLIALKLAVKITHPQLLDILKEAVNDPEEQISFLALKELKCQISSRKLAPLLVKFINSKSEEIRMFALKEIANITKNKYKANFGKINPETRKLVAKVIQKIDNSFADQLINELNSLDPQIRLQAALLLENIQVGNKGKEALLAAIKDPSKLVRAAVVKTLGVIGDSKLIKQLIEFFNDPDHRVRANAIEAIASLGDRQAIQLLLPYLEDKNNRIRANAIVGISKMGSFNLIPILQKMLSDSSANMQASALWAMGEINNKNFSNYVYPFLNNTNEMLRFNAVRTLSKINLDVLKPYFPKLLQDPSSKIRNFVLKLNSNVQ